MLNKHISQLFNVPYKKIFAFYVSQPYVIPDEWMTEIGSRLQKRGYAAIALVHHEIKDVMNFEALGNVFYVNREDVQFLNSVHCFIVTDLEYATIFPQTSKVVAWIHASDCSHGWQHPIQNAYLVGHFDAFCVGFPFWRDKDAIKKLWDNFPPSFRHQRPASDFYLIGCGYPKLNLMRAKLLDKAKELDVPEKAKGICYAPVDLNWAHELGGNRVEKYGLRLLRMLLQKFPEREIIFRPAPNNTDEKIVSHIESYFSEHKNFSVDRNKSYIETFVRSGLLITDFSHIGSTFSTLTGKHSIYFEPWKTDKTTVGALFYRVHSFTAILNVIQNIFASKLEYGFDSFVRHKGYIPFDNGINDFIDILLDLLEEKTRPVWLEIERKDKAGKGKNCEDVIAAILAEPIVSRPWHAVLYAHYFKSPPLAVLAFHINKLYAATQPVHIWIAELLAINTSVKQIYDDFTWPEIASMYLNAFNMLESDAEQVAVHPDFRLQKALFLELANAALEGKPL